MKYAYVIDNRVNQVIDEYNPDLPNVPITERYPQKIIDKLIQCEDNVHEGMDYNSETGEFTEHIDPVPEVENVEEIEEVENVEEVEEDGEGTEQPTEGTETTGSKWSN